MLNGTRIGVAMAALVLLCAPVVMGDENRLDALERRLDAQQAIIERQASQIQELKDEDPSSVATRDEIQGMVRKYLDIAAEKEGAKSGMLSMGEEWLKIGGELEIEFNHVEKDDHYWYITDKTGSALSYHGVTDLAAPGERGFAFGAVATTGRGINEIELDKARLDFKAYYTDEVYGHVAIEVSPAAELNVDQAYVHFGDLLYTLGIEDPVHLWMRAGWFSVLEKYDRETEVYGLLQSAFHRDEAAQWAFGADYDVADNVNLYTWLTFMNGRQIGVVSANDANVALGGGPFRMLQDDNGNIDVDLNNNKQIGWGAGVKVDMGDYGELDAKAIWYWGNLSEADQATLAGIQAYREAGGLAWSFAAIPQWGPYSMFTFFNSNRYERAGAHFDYNVDVMDYGNFRMLIAFEDVSYGEWDRRAYEFFFRHKIPLPGWEHAGRKWWTAVAPFMRFSAMDEKNITATPWDSRTWDRQKFDLGFIVDVTKNIKLKTEWSILQEDIGKLHFPNVTDPLWRPAPQSGGDDPDNDQFIVQLEAKF